MYKYWQSDEISKDVDLFFSLKRYYMLIDYYFRRTDRDNIAEKSKTFLYYCYATPLYFFQSLIFKCQTFDVFIQLIVPQLSNISEIATDCGMYCILNALNDRSVRLEKDGVSLNRGYALTIEFAVSFIRTVFKHVDISLLVEFVIIQLQQQNAAIIVLISKLISSVANVLPF